MFKLLCLILFSFAITFSQQTTKTGTLRGKVYDAEDKLPLAGVNVYIKDKNIGTATNADGNYVIENLPVGNYVVVYSFILHP